MPPPSPTGRPSEWIQPGGGPGEATEAANPPIYPGGCVGAITAARKADDGRYYINLTGISRFRIVRELPLKDGYRRVVADYSAFDGDLREASETIDRDRRIGALTAYLTSNELGADWSPVEIGSAAGGERGCP